MTQDVPHHGGSAVVSYMRTTDEALNELSRGLHCRGVGVNVVLCHSGEREAERDAAVWPDAVVATHGIRFDRLRAADVDALDGLSADVLAQTLPIAERSIRRRKDVNVSHLIQTVAAEHRRARELVERTKPSIGLFLAQPERLLDFFVHLFLKEARVLCIYPRIAPISGRVIFSHSRDAPLLAAHDRLAPETLLLQSAESESGEFQRHPIGGTGIQDVISWTSAARRGTLSLATKVRTRHRLNMKGQRTELVGSRNFRGVIVSYHLHLEPEATTYPANGFRSNQLNHIALLSEWVGGSGKVLVKEHPVMLARRTSLPSAVRNRTRTFYEAIRRLPNVVLLNPSGIAQHHVEHSDVVATVGGNVGWEALAAGVPVVHFGHASYENAIGAHRWTGGLLLNEVRQRSRSEVADAAQATMRLLVQNSHDDETPNRRVGRARALLAALDALHAAGRPREATENRFP